MKMANQFVCKTCGNTKSIDPSADLDFESCSCGSMGEWAQPKTAPAEILPQEKAELLPAHIVKMSAKDLFAHDQIREVVTWAKGEESKHTPDTSTDKGRKAIASNSARVSSTKVILEKIAAARKAEIKKDSEAEVEVIQTGLKYWVAELETLRDDSRKPLTEWEAEDKARKAAELLAEEISNNHDEALAEDDLFNRAREIERKEAKLVQIESDRVAKEEEEKAKQEAAATKKRKEKEQAARDEQIKKDAVAEAERLRLSKEKEGRENAAKKAANKNHRAKINNEVEKALVGMGMAPEVAKNLVPLMASGNIPHTSINYLG